MINKAILIGFVGADPDVRHTQNGSTVATFRLATSEKWKDTNGNLKEETEWHKCVIFGKTADFISAHVTKGAKLYVEGKIKTRKWQDAEGNDKYTTEIACNHVILLSAFKDDDTKAAPKDNGGTRGKSTVEDVPF